IDSSSCNVGSDPNPTPTDDIAREYLANGLTPSGGTAGCPIAACVIDRVQSCRQYIQLAHSVLIMMRFYAGFCGWAGDHRFKESLRTLKFFNRPDFLLTSAHV